ncbi:hypothetical protein ACS0TY_006260 [Phlomoides rotata]
MDGYNQYGWNHGFYQNEMVYPPQNGEFGYDNRRNFDYHHQMPQVPSYYQDWRNNEDWSHASPSNDFQPRQECDPSIFSSPHEGKATNEDALALILKKMEENEKVVSQHYKSLEAQFTQLSQQVTQMSQQQKTFESQISQLAIAIEKLQEEEEGEEDEEQSEDDNLIIKEDQEDCHLMDTSTKEQESQEVSKEDLKIEMSISQPLNSSICTFFDNDASIDFILPLDSFDNKKEVEKSLGILEQKGGEWKEMLRRYVEEKLSKNGMGDRSTCVVCRRKGYMNVYMESSPEFLLNMRRKKEGKQMDGVLRCLEKMMECAKRGTIPGPKLRFA